mmetsp:Transcript_77476/g.207789  ORF Transcript_77476/g.207789 Transcript_77476/m.207789 type:complete len:81 (+) Transcript_77476:1-243(+)
MPKLVSDRPVRFLEHLRSLSPWLSSEDESLETLLGTTDEMMLPWLRADASEERRDITSPCVLVVSREVMDMRWRIPVSAG